MTKRHKKNNKIFSSFNYNAGSAKILDTPLLESVNKNLKRLLSSFRNPVLNHSLSTNLSRNNKLSGSDTTSLFCGNHYSSIILDKANNS